MSRTKSETRSVIILRLGLSKVVLLVSVFLLALTMTALSWGEVHSFGNGPNFVVYPSTVVAGEGNQIKFRILSSDKNAQYDILLKNQEIHLRDSSVFDLDIPFDNSFTYLTIRGTKNWSTSTATLLVLSPKMKKVDVGKRLSIFFQPVALPTSLYVFTNSSFGRERLKIFLNSKEIGDYRLSPVEDSAKMFEIPIKSISSGIYKVEAQLSLITGQTLTAATTLRYILDKKPPKILGVDLASKIVGPKGSMQISVVATDQNGVKSVSVNDIEASLKNGKWVATLKNPFAEVDKSGSKILNLSIVATDAFNNVATTTRSTDVFVDVNPPYCQILPSSQDHTYSIPVTLNVKSWTDSGVLPTNVKVMLDGRRIKTPVKIVHPGDHILAMYAVNPVNGKNVNCVYKFRAVEPKSIPFWALVMFFVGTLVILLFTLQLP